MKKIFIIGVIALVVLGCVLAAGCTTTTQSVPVSTGSDVSITCPISMNENFKTINLQTTADEFEKLGFTAGDSVDIKFSNGKEYKDVPYVTGVFVKSGQLVVLNRSKVYNTIEIAKVGTGDEWNALGVTPNETVTIKLAEKQKYAEMQKLNTLKYGKDKSKFASVEEFTNFRALSGGNLKENYLYRGASAIDNTGGRVEDVNKLLEANGIKTLVDLSNSDEKIIKLLNKEDDPIEFLFTKAPFYTVLAYNGNIIAEALPTSMNNEKSHQQMVKIFKQINASEGPFYLYCLEGKNRTGLAAMLLEALAGATYEEMENDYMQTFVNYYHIGKDDSRYQQISDIRFKETLDVFAKNRTDYQKAAIEYLISGGMTEEEVNALIAKISK